MKHEFKIIPKEEVLANRSNAYEFIDFDKQETLEEVAEKYVNGRCTGGIMERALLSAIEFGAKWQQEQDKKMYSEEEVIDIAKQAFVLGKDFGLIGTFKEWFDTVKKK